MNHRWRQLIGDSAGMSERDSGERLLKQIIIVFALKFNISTMSCQRIKHRLRQPPSARLAKNRPVPLAGLHQRRLHQARIDEGTSLFQCRRRTVTAMPASWAGWLLHALKVIVILGSAIVMISFSGCVRCRLNIPRFEENVCNRQLILTRTSCGRDFRCSAGRRIQRGSR